MIFAFITNNKRRNLFDNTVGVLIFTFILTLGGCYTTRDVDINPENIKYKVDYEITRAVLKSGLVINLKDKGARYVSEYDSLKNVLLYSSVIIDTVQVEPVGIKKIYKSNVIELKDVIALTVEKQEFSLGLTIVATIGIIVGLLLLIGVIIAATKESCPFVYSFDGERYIFDAEPYGGAITEGLKKTDFSRLDNLKPVNGKYKLMMRNEADETQHTDEMKLLVIDHRKNTNIAADITGKMTVFSDALAPYSVVDEKENDITSFFDANDNIQWQTDLPQDTLFIGKDLKHELIFKFPKPKDAKTVKLLVNAGTALWGGYMIKEMLNLRGNNVDKWYENVDNGGIELAKLYQFMEREELYALKVYVKEKGGWAVSNYFPAGGPFLDEDRIVDLNIENTESDTLEIKLNPPYGYWKIDYVGVIYNCANETSVTELPLASGLDQDGEDLTQELSKIDGNYYNMYDSTYNAILYFNVPPPPKDGYTRSLFLKTTGYYDVHLKKDQPEQTEFIQKLYDTPGLILEYSLRKYVEKIKSLGFTK